MKPKRQIKPEVCRLIKKASILLVLVGSLLISVGIFQYGQTKNAQKASLQEAYELIVPPEEPFHFAKSAVENKKVTMTSNASFNPLQGEVSGILVIPALDAELPIIEGTDEDELEKGVGHFKGSAYPSQNDQIVLSGHRDTVFRQMGDLNAGDELIIKVPYGEFTYIIKDSQIVDANDTSIIKSTAPQEVLIVSTCYPFSYIGDAPFRYVLTALPAADKNEG